MRLIRDLSSTKLPPEPWLGPLEGTIWIYFVPPESWSARKRAAALRDELRPDVEPDCDNLSKAIWDALQPTRRRRDGRPAKFPRGVFRNDGQITDLIVRKRFGPEDKVVIEIVRLNLGRGFTPTQPSLL